MKSAPKAKPYRKVVKRRFKRPPLNHRKKLGPKCH